MWSNMRMLFDLQLSSFSRTIGLYVDFTVLDQIAGQKVLDASYWCPSGGYFSYATYPLTGNAWLELVVTGDCDPGGVGLDHWLVYPPRCEDD